MTNQTKKYPNHNIRFAQALEEVSYSINGQSIEQLRLRPEIKASNSDAAQSYTTKRAGQSFVREQVVRIVSEQVSLSASDISMTTSLEELGLDSMGLIEIIFALEEHFDISLPFDVSEPDKLTFDGSSVASIVATVENLIAEKEL